MKRWPSVDAVLRQLSLPDGYSFEQLREEHVDEVIASLLTWYPDVESGMESVHLTRDFYERAVELRNPDSAQLPHRDIIGFVARETAHGELIALLTLEKNDGARTLTSPLGAVHPEHRIAAFGMFGPLLLEETGRLIGAELLHYYATLKSKHQQVIAERRGFRLVGIMPAHDIDTVRPGVQRRVYEALYAKVLAEPAAIEAPQRADLTTTTQRLWAELFPNTPFRDDAS